MKRLVDVYSSPSAFDSVRNYMGETPPENLLVLMARNRDSDLLTESNWHCALERLGGESDAVVIHRFGHWACGWLEYLCVVMDTPPHAIADEIESALNGYPVLDEDDYSSRECDCANQTWLEWYSPKERIKYIRDHGGASFNSYADLLQCVRGKYAPFMNDGYDGLLY
jgi:hypothetical protein